MNADWLSYYGYSMGWSTVRKMPEKRAYPLFDRLADQVWKRRGAGVLQYEKNIKRVVPDASAADLRDLSRTCMRSYARYWCDAFRMPDWSDERLNSIHVVGMENLERNYAERDLAPVFVAPHAGNYDQGAAYLAGLFGSVTTVAERLKPEKLFRRFVAFRESRNVEIIPTGTPGTVDILAERIRAKKLVGVVGERDLSRHGIPVSFFGEEARMPAGASVLAHRTGADVIPVSFWYEGRQACAEIYKPIPVPSGLAEEDAIVSLTQSWADKLAEGIRQHPGDWHMLQPLWTADLDPARDPMRRAQSPNAQAQRSAESSSEDGRAS